ncbi:MAG: LCP family protein [Firmicutes bacterium]|nr:LCP family protein [Bacillota bacterium]
MKKWQKGLIIAIIVLLVLTIGIGSFVVSKLGLLNRVDIKDRELGCVDVDGYVNILLLGVDTRDMSNIEGAGADAIMILSLKEETGEVKLMSVYRDTYLMMGDEGYYDKITNANRIGGPALMMQSLNQAMDMNISKFAVVNFQAVADLVDAVGGITVNVEDYEIEQLNKYTKQTAKNIGKKDYQLVEKAGEQTLEGVQAVSYGRIRKGVGDDYKRTERMRIVVSKVFEKIKVMSVSELNEIVNLMMPQVQTNLRNRDIFTLAARLASFNIQGSEGWPYEKSSGPINGISYVYAQTLESNTIELHKKMFGQEDYQPSELVITMSNQIISDVSSSKNQKNKDKDKNKDKKSDKDEQKETEKDTNKDSQSSDKITEAQDDATAKPEETPEDTEQEETAPETGVTEPEDTETESKPETPEDTETESKPESGNDMDENTGK